MKKMKKTLTVCSENQLFVKFWSSFEVKYILFKMANKITVVNVDIY